MYPLFLFAIVNNHIEASRHGDKELVAGFQGMSTSVCPARHVVKIKHAFNAKRNMPPGFDKTQVAARISDLGQVNEFAIAHSHKDQSNFSSNDALASSCAEILGQSALPIRCSTKWTEREQIVREAG